MSLYTEDEWRRSAAEMRAAEAMVRADMQHVPAFVAALSAAIDAAEMCRDQCELACPVDGCDWSDVVDALRELRAPDNVEARLWDLAEARAVREAA